MPKKRLLEKIKLNAARYYRAPTDVIRDRRFSDDERLEILDAWERDARAMMVEDEESMAGGGAQPAQLRQVVEARLEVEKKVPGQTPIRDAGKYGSGSAR